MSETDWAAVTARVRTRQKSGTYGSVPLLIHWRETATGRTGIYEDMGYEDEPGEPILFWWEEGNASCDCNRSTFFLGDESVDDSCGDERFRVIRIEWPGGARDYPDGT